MNSKLHHGTRFVSKTDLCTPNGIRTRAATLKGWCPRPLDDGGKEFEFVGRASEIYQRISVVAQGALFHHRAGEDSDFGAVPIPHADVKPSATNHQGGRGLPEAVSCGLQPLRRVQGGPQATSRNQV